MQCYGMATELGAVCEGIRVMKLLHVRAVTSMLYMLAFPFVLLFTPTRCLGAVSAVYLISRFVLYKVIRARREYMQYVSTFADGWATAELVKEDRIAVTSRGKTYVFKLLRDDSVDDSHVHVEFTSRRCFVHPDAVTQEIIL